MMGLMYAIRKHYERVEDETALRHAVRTTALHEPMVLIPIEKMTVMVEKSLRHAWSISKDIRFVHISSDEENDEVRQHWSEWIEAPARAAGLPVPELDILPSPFRTVATPIVDYALQLQNEHPERHLAILVPELVERHWYNFLLHNNRPELLKALITRRGNPRITVVSIPWYLSQD
jgi:hypothetical protein